MICSQCHKEVWVLNYCIVGSKIIFNEKLGKYERKDIENEVCFNCRQKHQFQIIAYPKDFKNL